MDWTVTIICVGVFYLGFLLGLITQRWLASRRSYIGTIKVLREDEKIVYSLELDEDPIALQDRDEVIFKVTTSDENLDSDENIAYNRTN